MGLPSLLNTALIKSNMLRNEMHYYQFNIAYYRKDTYPLTPVQPMIYRWLIDEYYLNEKPFPNNRGKLLFVEIILIY